MVENVVTRDTTEEEAAQSEERQIDQANGERGRSTISFPYAALSEAERIAQELHRFGGAATPEGIAKVLGQSTRSGAFRQKLSAARVFGLVTTRPGQVSLSRLGRAVIDPEKQTGARAEAFLNVPLYKAIFGKYQGDLLPPTTTLDAEIADLGVSAKQASTARQIMFRSAEQAGFFARGPNRLVAPGGDSGMHLPGAQRTNEDRHERYANSLPEALEAPVAAMLETGESWTPQQTHEFVDGLRKMHRALRGTLENG